MLGKKKKEINESVKPIVNVMAKAGIKPNHLTIMGLFLGMLALLISFYNYWTAVIIFAITFSIDLFDGALARKTKNVTKFGAYLDSVCDKTVEILFITFITLTSELLLTGLFAATFSIMISYTKHRSECLGANVKHSIFDRAERLIYSLVMIILIPFLPGTVLYLFNAYVAFCIIAILQITVNVKKTIKLIKK